MMSLGAPTPSLLTAALRGLVERRPATTAVGFRCAGWDGPPHLEVAGRGCRIHWCPSALAVREVLARDSEGDGLTVILTDRGDDELGLDATARLLRNRLLEIDPWLALGQAFSASVLDSRLGEERWLADELLAALPAGGYPPVKAGTLDLDHAWSTFLEHRLALPDGAADLSSLLRWCETSEGPRRLRDLAEPAARRVLDHLRRRGGQTSAAVTQLAREGREADAIPLGLVCRVLYGGEPADADLAAGAARLEERLGGVTLKVREGRRWAAAAEARLAQLASVENASATVRTTLRRADSWLERLKIGRQAHRSSWLQAGYRLRLERFGRALALVLEDSPVKVASELEALGAEVQDHRQARGAAGAVAMALRLARFLEREERSFQDPGSFPEAAARYASDVALADLARGVLWGADAGSALSVVARSLLGRVLVARERFNRRFGELARGWFEADGTAPSLVPMEQVLERVVAPVAAQSPVLLLVLDGLSFAVYHRLLEDLLDQGWEPRLPADQEQAPVGLATLPGVTRLSRVSLLTGRLQEGSQPTERKGFASHPALLAHSAPNLPPILFHKADLRGESELLAEKVRRELARKNRRVVGVVHNAVDDHLSKGDQLSPTWTLAVLRHLEAVLDAAAEADRALVITADHGHLPETDTELDAASDGGERFRPASGEVKEGELLMQGRRVLVEGGTVIAPWSETVRYRRRKAGYHGGVSPQELLVPLTVLTPGSETLDGWRHQAGVLPSWWEPGGRVEEATPRPSTRPAQKRRKDSAQQVLFEDASVPTPARPDAEDPWAPLFASAVWQAQSARLGGRLPPERVRPVLDLLESHGGRLSLEAACRALNLGMPRLRSTVTQIQRLLNVDGYPILDLDEAADELRLAHDLLREQFELSER